jgi:hypothetical protein
MSRSGYSDEDDGDNFPWRAQVANAIRGKRGQAFLRDLLAAIQALPDKRLIAGRWVEGDSVCALGALGRARGVDMKPISEMVFQDDGDGEALAEFYGKVAKLFDIASQLAREVMHMNDEGNYAFENDEQRYRRMVSWVQSQITGG